MNQDSPQFQPIQRIVSALVFIPIFLLCLFSTQWWWLMVLVVISAVLAIIEFYNLVGIKGFHPYRKYGYLLVILFCINAAPNLNFIAPFQLVIVSILGSFLIAIFRFKPQNNHSVLRIATTILGILYIGLPFSLMLSIRSLPAGAFYLLWIIAVTWFCDIGAYMIGSWFGKHKLCPTISPNKTIEGAIGGIVFGIGIAIFVRWLVLHYFNYSLFHPGLNLIYAFIVPILAHLGDLAESVLKREVGVKDSGNSITGHGGILDIIDSLLFTIPAMYLILTAGRL